MLVEALLKPGGGRKPLGWLAILGTAAAGIISYYQTPGSARSPPSAAPSRSMPSRHFFHLLIAAVVLVTLLRSLDYFEGNAATPASTTPSCSSEPTA